MATQSSMFFFYLKKGLYTIILVIIILDHIFPHKTHTKTFFGEAYNGRFVVDD